VSGIAHVASNMSFNHDPNKVIPEVLAGITNMLSSAASSPSVKRFVYTSSSTAATKPYANKEFLITTDTWNDDDIRDAWASPPYEEERKWAVYGASKTQAEKAVWKFVEEKKPHFTCNAILPNCNFGKILLKGQPVSTAEMIKALYQGEAGMLKGFPPRKLLNQNLDIRLQPVEWFVDVQDVGRLHVAALTNPDVNNERIFAFAEPFNWK
jgi:nucleoside-diphosphate-sugar epimerase